MKHSHLFIPRNLYSYGSRAEDRLEELYKRYISGVSSDKSTLSKLIDKESENPSLFLTDVSTLNKNTISGSDSSTQIFPSNLLQKTTIRGEIFI
jgi:hypothetical protein